MNVAGKILTMQRMAEDLRAKGTKSCRKCGRVTGLKYPCDDGKERGITLLKNGVCMECEHGRRN